MYVTISSNISGTRCFLVFTAIQYSEIVDRQFGQPELSRMNNQDREAINGLLGLICRTDTKMVCPTEFLTDFPSLCASLHMVFVISSYDSKGD
jgi:hypothetical protein